MIIKYYKNGNKKKEYTLDERGVQGEYRSWYINGNRKIECAYINNKK